MDIRILLPSECFAVSAAWLDPKGPLLALLQSQDATRGLLPQISLVHQSLIRLLPSAAQSHQNLKIARDEADTLDDEHDDLYRGVFYLLTAASSFDPVKREALLHLRKRLLPDDLAGINKPYSVEAGEADRLEQRLDERSRDILAGITLNGITALQYIERLIRIGKKLGETEVKKQQIAKELENNLEEPSLSEINEGKARWFAVAKLFTGNIKLAGFSEEEQKLLLSPFEALEATCEERAHERNLKRATAKTEELTRLPDDPDAQ